MTTAHDISLTILRDIAAGRTPQRPWTAADYAQLDVDGSTILAPTGRRRVDRSAPGRQVADEMGYEGSVWNPDGGDLGE